MRNLIRHDFCLSVIAGFFQNSLESSLSISLFSVHLQILGVCVAMISKLFSLSIFLICFSRTRGFWAYIISQALSENSKSNRLHVDIFPVFVNSLRYIPWVPQSNYVVIYVTMVTFRMTLLMNK